MTSAWTWDPTLFAGAAPYYEKGRLPYALSLPDAFRDALGLDGRGRLLDVGCGPGTVALLLAGLFDSVTGVDADAGMLAEAARIAEKRVVSNARWVHLRAEELPAGLGLFRTVTFAASFHWMDRDRVAAIVRDMLDPGGVLVHVDNHHQDGVTSGSPMPHPPPPTEAIDRLRQQYLGAGRRAGQSVRNSSPDNEDAVFRGAGFSGPRRVSVPDGRVLARTIDDLVATTFSQSSTAPHLFGDEFGRFEADLRRLLAEASPSGLFYVRLPDNELKIWSIND